MARITWLGEDSLHKNGAGPSATTWAGRRFPKGEAVDVKEPDIIKKAQKNQFFKVEGVPGRPPKEKTDGDENES